MIEVRSLAKRFKLSKQHKPHANGDVRDINGWFHAVRDVSFHCAAGEVLGLLGPNGAGKTTSLRMLSTAIEPARGTITINGVDLLANPIEARKHFGFLSGATGLYNRLTVTENIRYFGEAHGIPRKQLEERIKALLDRLDMGSYADKRADALSAGMRQRALIARTVVHNPTVLILDEPTTGLDILGAQTVLDFMREYQQAGAAVIFSTHHLNELESLCKRVCIINTGVSVFEGALDTLSNTGKGDLTQGYLHYLGAASTTNLNTVNPPIGSARQH